MRDLLDRAVERLLVDLRRLREAADLADVLQRRGADLVVGRGGLEVVERADVAAHASSVGHVGRSRAPGCGRAARPRRRRRSTPPRTTTGPPAAAPSKKPVLRSRLPPAPGGSSWPSTPAGSGSSSGALETPENGLPTKTIVSAPARMPARPNSASRPATNAAIARIVRLSAPAFATHDPLDDVEPAVDDRRRDQAAEHRAGRDEREAPPEPVGRDERRERAGQDPGDDQRQDRRAERGRPRRRLDHDPRRGPAAAPRRRPPGGPRPRPRA